MDKNIQESKEFRLAKDWEMAVNSFSFNPKRFAAATEPIQTDQGMHQGYGR